MTHTQFEDRLLAELRQVVAARTASEAVAGSRRRRAPRLLLGGAATAVVTGTLLFVAAGGDRVPPAFAIERQPDGNVTVKINRLSDADGLQRQLRAAGIAAVVNYTPLGKACREPRGRRAAPPQSPTGASVSGSSATGHASSFTITRNMVGVGQTLVIMTSGGDGASSVGMEVVQGPVSPCKLVNAPAPPFPAREGFSTARTGKYTSSGTESRSLHTGQRVR
jgi:hypothetical protein